MRVQPLFDAAEPDRGRCLLGHTLEEAACSDESLDPIQHQQADGDGEPLPIEASRILEEVHASSLLDELHSRSIVATARAMAIDAVRPGDSIPPRCTYPSSCQSMKSGSPLGASLSFGR